MTTLERLALAAIVAGSFCYATPARSQGPTLPGAPSSVDRILPQGIVELAPGAIEALVLPGNDTVFVQAVTANNLAVWDGRKLAGVSGITLHRGEPMPSPDDKPVLCAHGGEVCIVFVAREGQYLATGIVYKPTLRS